jgi:hypothetical protein
MITKKEFEELKQRVSLIERMLGLNGEVTPEVIETDIVLPEADIGGLRFNETKVRAVFEKDKDGVYYSRDILFLSVRDSGTGRDLLSEYLDSEAVREAFRKALGRDVEVFLPEENRGVKKYNGVICWHWLRPRSSGSAAHFCGVGGYGGANISAASAVGGCAPAFRVAGEETNK